MRTPLIGLALLLAGCVGQPGATNELTPAATDLFVPFHAEGTFWVQSSQRDLTEVEIPFLVNGTERVTTATITVGSRYGPAEMPRSTAYLEAEILDADGVSRAEARRMPLGEPTIKLRAEDLPVGEATLVLRIGGGSDETANGDYVRYVLDVG